MSAKDDLLSRWSSFNLAVSDSLLIDNSVQASEHNSRARILRNGLAVVGFAMIEDFIRSRLSEVFYNFNQATYSFAALPDRLRSAVTSEAIHGLSSQMKIRHLDSTDAEQLAIAVGTSISSLKSIPFDMTSIGFASGSNVQPDDINSSLKALSVGGGWEAIDDLAARSGMSGLALKDAFRNMARSRHGAAHVASANIPTGDLQSASTTIISIAVSFDALVTTASRKFIRQDARLFSGGVMNSSDVSLRFIEESNGIWREFKEGAKRATALHSSLDAAIVASIARNSLDDEITIVLSRRGTVQDWYS